MIAKIVGAWAVISAIPGEFPAKPADGRTATATLAEPQVQAKGSILLAQESWGLV